MTTHALWLTPLTVALAVAVFRAPEFTMVALLLVFVGRRTHDSFATPTGQVRWFVSNNEGNPRPYFGEENVA